MSKGFNMLHGANRHVGAVATQLSTPTHAFQQEDPIDTEAKEHAAMKRRLAMRGRAPTFVTVRVSTEIVLTNESIHRGSQGFLMIVMKWTAQKTASVIIPLARTLMCGETDQLLGEVQTTERSALLSATM
jgi:hypothetical protein